MEHESTAPRFRPPGMMGHRGAAALAPENTLAALRAAKAAGCTWVELDVMLSGDGVPVLHHDISLRRTAGYRRKLRSMTAAELSALDVVRGFAKAFSGEGIPTLEEALREMLALDLVPNLELKSPRGADSALVDAIVESLRASWPTDRPKPLLSSFHRGSLELLLRRAPDYPRALIATRFPRDWRRAMETLGCAALHLNRRHVTLHRITIVREAGFAVGIYTVNDPGEARLYQRWGTDCIITDMPQLIGPVLSRSPPP